MFSRINKKASAVLLGYALFALLSFSFFFYRTFPFSLLESRLLHLLEEQSGCAIDVDEKDFYLPLRLEWKGVRVGCLPFLEWKIASIDIDVAPFPLIWHRRGDIDFLARLSEGEIQGRLSATRKDGAYAFSLKNEWRRLNLSSVGLSGILGLSGEGVWRDHGLLRGEGGFAFNIEEAHFKEFRGWVSPIGDLNFSNIHGKIRWRGGTAVFERLIAQGSEVDLSAEDGSLLLREPFLRSIMTLSLKVVPKGKLKDVAKIFIQDYSGRGPLTLKVQGVLAQPDILVNGQNLPYQ